MKYSIIDYPHFVPASAYEGALTSMTEKLMSTGVVASVYQTGGISSPGISDLDVVAVVMDGATIKENLLQTLSPAERYLFLHSPFGISESDFADAQYYAFYYNYELRAGKDLLQSMMIGNDDLRSLKIQYALEYLFKLFLTLTLQKEYKVLRMRDLLLHVKGSTYDLDFLGVREGPVWNGVVQVLEWRKNWFSKTPTEKQIVDWFDHFYGALTFLLENTFKQHQFYLPKQEKYALSSSNSLIPSADFSFERKGMMLPSMLSAFGKRYFKLQNKLNAFEFHVPVSSEDIPHVLVKKFQFEKKITGYNKRFLPYFLPLSSSLHAI